MENLNLRGRIRNEIENLIMTSCLNKNVSLQFKNLHVVILKKYYNASDVSIDYHRRRIKMQIVMNDDDDDSKTVNLNLPTLHSGWSEIDGFHN